MRQGTGWESTIPLAVLRRAEAGGTGSSGADRRAGMTGGLRGVVAGLERIAYGSLGLGRQSAAGTVVMLGGESDHHVADGPIVGLPPVGDRTNPVPA